MQFFRFKKIRSVNIVMMCFLLITVFSISQSAFSHCDTLDGPVVLAAKTSLETGNLNLALIWVQNKDEREIRKAFEDTMTVRKSGGTAKELADRFFLETLVRLHRSGEGAPFTGLKSAGQDLGPAIPAADKALEEGDIEPLVKMLTNAIQSGLKKHFQEARSNKKFKSDNVKAGRAFVEKYVSYVHYVEGLYEASKASANGHYPDATSHFGH